MLVSVGSDHSGPQELPWECWAVLACVVMACLPQLQADEQEAGRDRKSLACRRSVSWYGLRLNLIKESGEATTELSQV